MNDLVSKDVIVSVGHSSCCLDGGQAVVKKGASLITHLFNAMLPVGGVGEIVWFNSL